MVSTPIARGLLFSLAAATERGGTIDRIGSHPRPLLPALNPPAIARLARAANDEAPVH